MCILKVISVRSEQRHYLAALFAVVTALAGPASIARADNSEICGDENAGDATRLTACGRVIAAYRPSNSGSAGAAVNYNNVQLARLNRIDIYDRQGKYDLAIKDADAAIRLGSSDPLVTFFHRSRTDLLIKLKDYDRALSGLSAAIARKTDYQAILYQIRAGVWNAKRDFDRAVSDISEAIRIDPKQAFFLVTRADYWVAKKDYEKAEMDYATAFQITPDNASLHFRRAGFWHGRGATEKALADYADAVRIDPQLADGYNGRALVWRDLGEYDKALADLDQAVKINPKGSTSFANRGEIWRLKGDLDRALADQDQAIVIDPRNGVALTLRGDTRRYRGEFARAIADYNEALRQDPGLFISIATGRGLTYVKSGDVDKARKEFEAAINAGRNVGLVDIEKSRFETAEAHLAALNSGAPLPAIPLAPVKTTSANSIPTAAALIPAAPSQSPQATPIAQHGRRVALVIGNSAYKNVSVLANPQKDASAIAAAFRNIGFETVVLASDASREKLIEALRAFAEEAEKADWAIVYYAGHGIEVNGVNYLIPVDAALKADRDVQFETVPLDQVMASVEGAKKLRVVMLDACRDNPFTPAMRRTAAPAAVAAAPTAGGVIATRSVGRGLGEVKVSGASLVVYAAKHGQTALDGEGENSPFAIALVQRLATPGVEINKIFRLVRDDVMEATAGRQEPFTYGSLPGREDFFFVAGR